jgi:hypothetical protein
MPKPAQAYEPEVPLKVREWISPALSSKTIGIVVVARLGRQRAGGAGRGNHRQRRWRSAYVARRQSRLLHRV